MRQVLPHRQVAKNVVALRDEADAAPNVAEHGARHDRLAAVGDRA